MKKLLLWLLIASVFITGGCSYIEHTQGADSVRNPAENGIINETDDAEDAIPAADAEKDAAKTDLPKDSGQSSSQTGKVDDIKPDPPRQQDASDDEASMLRVHIIDVGQGDSILIETENKYMLIDAGERNKGKIVTDYLDDIGVEKLDYIIATHPHSDHIGGLADVIKHFEVGKIIMPNAVHTSKTYEDLLDTISEKGLKITKAVAGNEYKLGKASFVILAPNSSDYDNLNNYSVAVKLINDNNSFIFAGDAEVQSENEMLQNGINLDADVLKLGHHGSSTGSSKFLDAVSPEIAVISAGEGNQYSHPHTEVLQALKERNIKLYRTDKQGTIILESDGSKISADKDPYKINEEDLKTKTDNISDDTKSSADRNKTDSGNTGTSKTDTAKTDKDKTDTAGKNKDTSKNITVHITKTGSKYHRAGCRHLSKSDIEVTLAEALSKGLTPCKTCNPPAN